MSVKASGKSQKQTDALAKRLLAVVGDLAHELHPRRRRKFPLDLDRSLDRDLGFDSLGRA